MSNKNLVLTAMIFAVAMMFIDQTIVALAIPTLNHDLHLTATAGQWVVNGYLLALAALFPLAVRALNAAGLGPLRSELSVGELRRSDHPPTIENHPHGYGVHFFRSREEAEKYLSPQPAP